MEKIINDEVQIQEEIPESTTGFNSNYIMEDKNKTRTRKNKISEEKEPKNIDKEDESENNAVKRNINQFKTIDRNDISGSPNKNNCLQERLKKILMGRDKGKFNYSKHDIPDNLKYHSDESESSEKSGLKKRKISKNGPEDKGSNKNESSNNKRKSIKNNENSSGKKIDSRKNSTNFKKAENNSSINKENINSINSDEKIRQKEEFEKNVYNIPQEHISKKFSSNIFEENKDKDKDKDKKNNEGNKSHRDRIRSMYSRYSKEKNETEENDNNKIIKNKASIHSKKSEDESNNARKEQNLSISNKKKESIDEKDDNINNNNQKRKNFFSKKEKKFEEDDDDNEDNNNNEDEEKIKGKSENSKKDDLKNILLKVFEKRNNINSEKNIKKNGTDMNFFRPNSTLNENNILSPEKNEEFERKQKLLKLIVNKKLNTNNNKEEDNNNDNDKNDNNNEDQEIKDEDSLDEIDKEKENRRREIIKKIKSGGTATARIKFREKKNKEIKEKKEKKEKDDDEKDNNEQDNDCLNKNKNSKRSKTEKNIRENNTTGNDEESKKIVPDKNNNRTNQDINEKEIDNIEESSDKKGNLVETKYRNRLTINIKPKTEEKINAKEDKEEEEEESNNNNNKKANNLHDILSKLKKNKSDEIKKEEDTNELEIEKEKERIRKREKRMEERKNEKERQKKKEEEERKKELEKQNEEKKKKKKIRCKYSLKQNFDDDDEESEDDNDEEEDNNYKKKEEVKRRKKLENDLKGEFNEMSGDINKEEEETTRNYTTKSNAVNNTNADDDDEDDIIRQKENNVRPLNRNKGIYRKFDNQNDNKNSENDVILNGMPSNNLDRSFDAIKTYKRPRNCFAMNTGNVYKPKKPNFERGRSQDRGGDDLNPSNSNTNINHGYLMNQNPKNNNMNNKNNIFLSNSPKTYFKKIPSGCENSSMLNNTMIGGFENNMKNALQSPTMGNKNNIDSVEVNACGLNSSFDGYMRNYLPSNFGNMSSKNNNNNNIFLDKNDSYNFGSPVKKNNNQGEYSSMTHIATNKKQGIYQNLNNYVNNYNNNYNNSVRSNKYMTTEKKNNDMDNDTYYNNNQNSYDGIQSQQQQTYPYRQNEQQQYQNYYNNSLISKLHNQSNTNCINSNYYNKSFNTPNNNEYIPPQSNLRKYTSNTINNYNINNYNNNYNNNSFNNYNNNSFNNYNNNPYNNNYYNSNNINNMNNNMGAPSPSYQNERNTSINIEDLLVLEEKLNEIISSLNKNGVMHYECFEFWNYYYNCSLYGRLEKLFTNISDRSNVQISINYLLMSLMICYDFSFEIEILNNECSILEEILKTNHKNLMIIYEHILSKISIESKSNIWVYKLKTIVDSFNSIDNSEYKGIKGNNMTLVDKIVYNTNVIMQNMRVLLKTFKTQRGDYLTTIFKKINEKSYEEINTFFLEYILRVENINGSVLASSLRKENVDFQTEPAPYIKTKNQKPYSLILDLDETLVHFKTNNENDTEGYLRIRPGLSDFLEKVSKYYELIVFTAATQDYGDLLIDSIEENKIYFEHRFYRQHTVIINNDFVKDLTRVGRPLDKIIIVDNMPQNFRLQKENGINIKAFWGEDTHDNALHNLGDILINIAKDGGDIRDGLFKYRDDIVKKVTSNLS